MSLQKENQHLRQRVTELEQQIQQLQPSFSQQKRRQSRLRLTKKIEVQLRRLQRNSKDSCQLSSSTQPAKTDPDLTGLPNIPLSPGEKKATKLKVLRQKSADSPLGLCSSEAGLQDSEELFRAYIETANDIIYTLDLTGAFTFINSYGQKVFGCTEAEVIGQPYLSFVAPTSQEKVAQAFKELLQTGDLRDFEFLLQPKAGLEIYLEANGRLLYRNGELVGVIGIARDITERKRFERQLQMFLKAIESAYDSAVITDLNGWILYANPAASRVFGHAPGTLKGQNASIFYPEKEQAEWLTQQAIAGGWSGEVICQRQAGALPESILHERFPALISVGPICDENSHPTAVSIISRDITNQKQIQAELAAKNLELERASSLKSTFLANMSHELRTPLTSILGFSSLLKKQVFGTLSRKQLDYVNHIHESGNHLLSLINDVLDLSKVEAGQISLHITSISVFDLCQSTLALVSEQAGSRGLFVHQAIQSNLGFLMADELRVKQMLLNLLSNAIKFSKEGGEIGLEAKTQAGYLLLTVWDTGIGIPEEKYHLLFQPFQQLENSLDRRYEGTGLGLALTQQMAELHGGTVEFESKVGQGSRFVIRLPFSLGYNFSEERLDSAKVENSQGLPQAMAYGQVPTTQAAQVLIVEDHASNALFLQDILRHWGYKTHHAEDGLQALDWLTSHQPELILMDIHLPGLDGLEMTQCIRSNPKWKGIPVVAITAFAMPDDRDRCLAAGLQDYVSKPFNYEELATVIEKYTTRKSSLRADSV
jgi:PAS domain S-box-containing protein